MAGFDMCSLVVVAMVVFTVSPASVHAHGGSNINDTLLDIINGCECAHMLAACIRWLVIDASTAETVNWNRNSHNMRKSYVLLP